MSTVYKIQHKKKSGDWKFSNLHVLGTPKNFRLGVATNLADAFNGLDWLSAKHPKKQFRVMEVETSFSVVERPKPTHKYHVRQYVKFIIDGACGIVTEQTGRSGKLGYIVVKLDGIETGCDEDRIEPCSVKEATDWMLSLVKKDPRANPYPNIGSIGKVKVDTEDQAGEVRRILLALNLIEGNALVRHSLPSYFIWEEDKGWGINSPLVTDRPDSPWLQNVLYQLSDFEIEPEPKLFGPEDEWLTIYDQNGNEALCHE